jgi:hypothetical protein
MRGPQAQPPFQSPSLQPDSRGEFPAILRPGLPPNLGQNRNLPPPGSPGFALGLGENLTRRPHAMTGLEQQLHMPLSQRTMSPQQRSQVNVARSATIDPAAGGGGSNSGRPHGQEDGGDAGGYSGGYHGIGQHWPHADGPGSGTPSLYSEPDVVESATGYIVSHFERELLKSHAGSRPQSPAAGLAPPAQQPPHAYSPHMPQFPREIERRVMPPSPWGPPSLGRSASFDVMDQQQQHGQLDRSPFAASNVQRPGSSASMRTGGVVADYATRGLGSPLVKLNGDGRGSDTKHGGLAIIERDGAQRTLAQVVHHHAPLISPAQTAKIQMSPTVLGPGGLVGPPTQSPHRSPVMRSSPHLSSPMSATFDHAGSAGGAGSAVPLPRGPSPRPQGRSIPPQGQYAISSRPGTPQLAPRFPGQAF